MSRSMHRIPTAPFSISTCAAFGKGYEAYYNRAKELGVNYIRSRPSAVKEVPATKNLTLQYQQEDGRVASDEFDLIVLSLGVKPLSESASLARIFGIDLNEHGFAGTRELAPTESSRPGIYVAGVFPGPRISRRASWRLRRRLPR